MCPFQFYNHGHIYSWNNKATPTGIPTIKPSASPTNKPTAPLTDNPTPMSWEQIGQMIITGEASGEDDGVTVAISEDGMTLALGDWGYDNDTGRVKIYRRVNGNGLSNWVEHGRELNGIAPEDR